MKNSLESFNSRLEQEEETIGGTWRYIDLKYPDWGIERIKNKENLTEPKRCAGHHLSLQYMYNEDPRRREEKERCTKNIWKIRFPNPQIWYNTWIYIFKKPNKFQEE